MQSRVEPLFYLCLISLFVSGVAAAIDLLGVWGFFCLLACLLGLDLVFWLQVGFLRQGHVYHSLL